MIKKNIAIVGPNKIVNVKIGKILAEQLEMDFISTDEYIEVESGVSPALLVVDYGSKYFCQLESKQLKTMSGFDNTLISTSTSTILDVENIYTLSRFSYIVLLVADPEIILDRLKKDSGIVLREEFLNRSAEVFASMKGALKDIADIIVDTNVMPPLKIANKIIAALKSVAK